MDVCVSFKLHSFWVHVNMMRAYKYNGANGCSFYYILGGPGTRLPSQVFWVFHSKNYLYFSD